MRSVNCERSVMSGVRFPSTNDDYKGLNTEI